MAPAFHISVTVYTVLLFCLSWTSASSWINEENDIVSYRVTNDTPTHIEADQFIPGNVLYSDLFALYTTNGPEASVIVGQTHRFPALPYQEGIGMNATFSKISSFARVNVTHILLADSERGCIRIVDRTTNQTAQFLGICKKKSWNSDQVDGKLLESRFSTITGFTYFHGRKLIYIFEKGIKKRITKADVKANLVETIIRTEDFRSNNDPREGLIDENRGVLYVSITFGIAEIYIANDTFRFLGQDGSGYADGPLADTEWYWSMGMAMYGNNTLIVADANNNKLRVVDLPSTNVTTWCFKNQMDPSKLCYIRRPVPVHIIDCEVYIGVHQLIAKLRLQTWICSEKEAGIQLDASDDSIHENSDAAAIGGGIAGGLGAVGMTVGIVYYMTKKRSQLTTIKAASTAEYRTFNPSAGPEGGQEAEVELYSKKPKMK